MNKSRWSRYAVAIVFALVILLLKTPSVYADRIDDLNDSWAAIPKSGSCGPNATYTVKDNVLTISGTGEVTESFSDLFGHFIEKVVIEEGITSISDHNLVGAYLDDEMEYRDMRIRDYYVPLSVTKIGLNAMGYYWFGGYELQSVNLSIHTSKRAAEAIRYAKENGFNLVYDYPKTTDINTCTVTGVSPVVYTGSPRTQNPTVKTGSIVLTPGTDYTLSYVNNVNAGVATVKISGKGEFSGTITKTFQIVKAANTMTVKKKTASVKYAKLKKKKQTIPVKSVLKLSKSQGTVTFKKVSGNKKITINKKNGKVTVKKGLKKGTYKIKIKVKAAGNRNYEAIEKKVTLKIKVKK